MSVILFATLDLIKIEKTVRSQYEKSLFGKSRECTVCRVRVNKIKKKCCKNKRKIGHRNGSSPVKRVGTRVCVM